MPGRIGAGLSGAISAVGSFASSMASGALRAGQQFLSNLVNTLASIPGRMVSIGSQIVHGIISGITGSIGKVGSAILGGVKDYAHRGCFDKTLPENSLTAIRIAADKGLGL